MKYTNYLVQWVKKHSSGQAHNTVAHFQVGLEACMVTVLLEATSSPEEVGPTQNSVMYG